MHLSELAQEIGTNKKRVKEFLEKLGYYYGYNDYVAPEPEMKVFNELLPIIEKEKEEAKKKKEAEKKKKEAERKKKREAEKKKKEAQKKKEAEKKKKEAEKKKKEAEKKKKEAEKKKKEAEKKKKEAEKKKKEAEKKKVEKKKTVKKKTTAKKTEKKETKKTAAKKTKKQETEKEEDKKTAAKETKKQETEKEGTKKTTVKKKTVKKKTVKATKSKEETAVSKVEEKKEEKKEEKVVETVDKKTTEKAEVKQAVEKAAEKKVVEKKEVEIKKEEKAKPKVIEKVPIERLKEKGIKDDILRSLVAAQKNSLTKRVRTKPKFSGVKNKEEKLNKPHLSEFAIERQKKLNELASSTPTVKRGGPARPFKRRHKRPGEKPIQQKGIITVYTPINIRDFSQTTGIKAGNIIGFLMRNGIMASINEVIDDDTIELIADEFNLQIEIKSKEEDLEKIVFDETENIEQSDADFKPRMPVVTFMGHVDHGKTSLLDAIRKTNVVAKESGGITQHIGASEVKVKDGWITFIDTPGHEAFTSMRARGANVTDIAVLVVAADDGLMPQSLEAIDHARAAKVPIIVAVNKIDLAGADPDRVLRQLAERDLTPEDWGGDVICCKVSAITGDGLDELLEMILLQAEMLELKAQEDALAEGVVIESDKDPSMGAKVSVLVQNGTLKKGDPIVCDTHFAKVRTLINTKGEQVESAGPSRAVQVLGFNDIPTPGTKFRVAASEKHAKELVEKRQIEKRELEHAKARKVSLENFYRRMEKSDIKELSMIIKADTQGTTEAVRAAVERLSTNQAKVTVISCGVGDVNDNDVMLASASDAIILAFKVKASSSAKNLAASEGVEIKNYDVIYHATDEIKLALTGLLEPVYKEITTGAAEIRQVFKLSSGIVAGCYVTDGVIERANKARIYRDGEMIFEGEIQSLKHLKDEVKEIRAGMECGIIIKNFTDYKESDRIESFRLEQQTPQL